MSFAYRCILKSVFCLRTNTIMKNFNFRNKLQNSHLYCIIKKQQPHLLLWILLIIKYPLPYLFSNIFLENTKNLNKMHNTKISYIQKILNTISKNFLIKFICTHSCLGWIYNYVIKGILNVRYTIWPKNRRSLYKNTICRVNGKGLKRWKLL